RQEPSALVAHAGICAGGWQQYRSLPRSLLSVDTFHDQLVSPAIRLEKPPTASGDVRSRFGFALATAAAWFGAHRARYAFGVELLNLLLHAGLSRRIPPSNPAQFNHLVKRATRTTYHGRSSSKCTVGQLSHIDCGDGRYTMTRLIVMCDLY